MGHRLLLSLALGIAGASGCSGGNSGAAGIPQAAMGEPCSTQSGVTCSAGVCAAGFCRTPCATDSECAGGALCVGSQAPLGCQLEHDRQCGGTDKCEPGLVCGIDGTCRMACNPVTSCARSDQECLQGTCVAKSESGAGSTWFSCHAGDLRCGGADGVTVEECNVSKPGWAPVSGETDVICIPTGSSCETPGSRCADPLAACVFGYCRPGCATDSDCVQGPCIGLKEPYGCQLPQDMACSASQPCTAPLKCAMDGSCRMPCVETKDCPRNDQRCFVIAGACVGDSEKGPAAEAFHSCGVGFPMRCAGGSICTTPPCFMEICNETAPGWTKADECPTDRPYCFASNCSETKPEPPGPMVQVPAPGGGTYGIDVTEVTRAQYAKFVHENWDAVTNGATAPGLPPGCEWKAGWAGDFYTSPGNLPITGADWCDAYMYCKWAGKRLCGKMGGGASLYDDFDDASKNQWFHACTSGGLHAWPYGDVYDVQKCNAFGKGIVATGASPGCQSLENGYAGVYDLIGNAAEWEDSCAGVFGRFDLCRVRGGAANSNTGNPACDYSSGIERRSMDVRVGFRCCSP